MPLSILLSVLFSCGSSVFGFAKKWKTVALFVKGYAGAYGRNFVFFLISCWVSDSLGDSMGFPMDYSVGLLIGLFGFFT
jgi:hypothetical protein